MGKRKYNDQNEGESKKPKTVISVETEKDEEVQPQNETDKNDDQVQVRPGGFDVKYFRKELNAKQGQTMVLNQFLQVCLNPDNDVDYLMDYLKAGGNSHEILRQITQTSKKNLTLATPVFHLFHLIIVKVQSSMPHMIAITEEACRYFLNTFMSTVEIMISENSGPRHRKIVLKLLTSMVTLNPDLGIEVLNQAPLTPKHLKHVVDNSNYKEKDNVRTSFVHFMTSFLVDGHLPLMKALLEKQGLLGLVIPGLIYDEAEAVLIFLNILKKNVIDNTLISKSMKLKTFNHTVLHNMFRIFSWKGPPELSYTSKNELRLDITKLLSEILLTLFTSHRLGLYFVDTSLGTDVNKNQNLYKSLLTLKRPWENDEESEVIQQIVQKCPDLHRAIINVVEQSFDPQHSLIWEKTITFTVNMLERLRPEEMASKLDNLNPTQAANFVRFITLPVPLLKLIQTNLRKDESISLYCVKVLVKMLQILRRYIQILEMNDSSTRIVELRSKLEYFFPKHLPAPTVLVSLIDDVIASKEENITTQDYRLPTINKTDALISLVDLLLLYSDIHPSYFETLEGTLNMKKILDFSMTLSEGRISVLKFKVVSLWLTLDNSAISIKNPMFKDLFLIMLDVYMSDNDSTWIEAKDTLHVFFKNTSIFEGDDDEIHLILYTLRNAKVNPPSLIGDIIEYVLANIADLTEYIRNQAVNYEISSETSQASLEKLFDDLMDNKNTEDSVFLENKIPSTFIVGCMQYIQSHKDLKKSIKHFLSLYVVNLLHSNFSPELTEILIGDCKLDARSYVASWTAEPVSLPEAIISQDNVMKNISSTLIDNENMLLNDMFPFIEVVAAEDSEFVIDSITYKVNVRKAVDSSEMLIWAKYLIFCTVRLTNMDQLKKEQIKKITDYFQCIIMIARKHHKVDVCRTVILNLFKNTQVLNIFAPLDLNKNESALLATKFLLHVVTEHKDVVYYLNNKHKLLKAYQQKNYNEIVKAFIKIKKRKNANSEHTTNVLNIIGLANEDDLRIFNQIFSADIAMCVREDKEPSFVLELLSNLINKYSTTITLEIQPQILRKAMILYTELLIHKEMTPNLTNLETSLTIYFENKPHQVTRVSEDLFKKFFQANSVRKSTAQLASVLLKYNMKLCSAFKEQTVKPEILSLRELTLPLGMSIINHNQFLLENKEFLLTIYNEYKSNISKMLEKPHKAGQIYVSCFKFIKKLILECMEVQDCDMYFGKIHKFETVEPSHIELVQCVFLKLCTSGLIKKDHLINYFMATLNVTTLALKESKDDVLLDIVNNINNVVELTNTVKGLNIEQPEEFKKLIESAIWQNFTKTVLKDSLKIKTADQVHTTGPRILGLLTRLIKLVYPHDHDEICTIFDMVTSHSEFLNVMLSHYSTDIKSRLIELLYTLIVRNKTVMKAAQIPVYLSSYHATRSPGDRLILNILYHYESNGLPVNEYKPYVWGDSAANYYAVRKNRTSSLWGHPTPNQVINLFDKDVIERTIRYFPVTQTLDYYYGIPVEVSNSSVKDIFNCMIKDNVFKFHVAKDNEGAVRNVVVKGKYNSIVEDLKVQDLVSASHLDEDVGIYDPVFLFPLLSHLLAPGSMASCFKLLRVGLLSVPVMGLSSHCPMMRAAAYHVLHRFCLLLETESRHKNDKLFLNDFITTLRQSLNSAINNADNDSYIKDARNPRLPAIDALYLARGLMVCTAPFDPLYKPINNFLIAKQFVDLTVVPDFLSLFHDSDVESVDRRLWILEIIRDGAKTITDINVIFKTMCLKMIMDFYSSIICDRKTKQRILELLSSLVAIPRAFDILLEGHGLLSWLHSAGRQLVKDDRPLIKPILQLIKNIIYSMLLNSFTRTVIAKTKATNKGKGGDVIELKANKDLESELLVVLYDLLKHIENLDIEDVGRYMKIYKLLTKGTVKCLARKQIIALVNKIGGLLGDCESVKLLNKAIVSNETAVLKSKMVNTDLGEETKNCLLQDLGIIVQNYFA